MRTKHTITLAAALLLVAGCAPVSFGGVTLAARPGAGYHLSQCASILGYSPEAARMGVTTPVVRARAVQSMVRQIQSHFSFGYTANPSMDSWKRAASGEC